MAHSKVLFGITKDEDDYPPVDIEGVWAEEQENGGYKLDNIPFFTRQATFGDIVEVRLVDGDLHYVATLNSSSQQGK